MEVQGTHRCPSCGQRNRSDRRYCAECGDQLGAACGVCGIRNEPGEKFCGSCGAALCDDAAVPRRTEAPLPAPDTAAGERRQLTVLFCDLVGSTPLSQQLDAEEWRDVIGQYQQAASGAVGRFGGHVARKLGDGLLIYFGWPTAREDDPERAVRAGLAIVDAMGPLNGTLAAGDGPRLAVRIGLHTGPVVTADGGEVFARSARRDHAAFAFVLRPRSTGACWRSDASTPARAFTRAAGFRPIPRTAGSLLRGRTASSPPARAPARARLV